MNFAPAKVPTRRAFAARMTERADTDKDLLGTAYYAYSTRLVAKAAAALGRSDDAARYEKRFQEIKAAFIAKYVSADGRIAKRKLGPFEEGEIEDWVR